MTRIEVVRYAILAVPCLALLAVARRGPATVRERGALLFAAIAAFLGVGALHEIAVAAGWWYYAEVAGAWRGLPVDLWIGWAVLWGPLPVALRRHVPLPLAVLALAWVDVLAMPALEPLVVLEAGWLWGEALGLGAILVPTVLLGSWMADDRRLVARTSLQMFVFAGVVLWLVPTTAFTFGDGGWAALADRSYLQLVLAAQLAAVVALPGLSAVQELVVQGRGTPYPWDPTQRLVVTGPYAYLANPMQLSATLLVLLLALLTASWALAGAAVVAVAFSATVAQPHEAEHLRARFGPAVEGYRAHVRTWRPRWRPFVVDPATLFVAEDCTQCQELGAAVTAAGPTALETADARRHPDTLLRVRYHAGPVLDDGLPAVGRALERIHLGAAVIGWALRLPVLRHLFQAIADTVAPPARRPDEVTA